MVLIWKRRLEQRGYIAENKEILEKLYGTDCFLKGKITILRQVNGIKKYGKKK